MDEEFLNSFLETEITLTYWLDKKYSTNSYGLHGICDDVVHLQHDQSYMGCRQLPVIISHNFNKIGQ